MERQLWVDFNDVDERGYVLTLLKFREPGVTFEVGDRIVVGDDEGTRAYADVVEVEQYGIVALAIDVDTVVTSDDVVGAEAS